MSKMKKLFTLALVALGIAAFAPSAQAEKTYGIEAGAYVYSHQSDTNPCDEHGSRYTHYVMKQADAKAAMGTTATVTYQSMADWLGKDFAANKASVIANAEKIDFDQYVEGDQYFFEKDGSEEAGVGDAIGVFFYDDGANDAYNVMSNNDTDEFHFDDETIGTSSGWLVPTPAVTVPIVAKPVQVANATCAVYTNGYLSAETAPGEWAAWSNRTATVVYTANPGFFFPDGSAEVTCKLDTTVDPAVVAKGEKVPGDAVKATLSLGVVAQRYPWNGIVDVNYKTEGWPKKDGLGAVEITCGDQVTTNTLDIYATGKGKTGVASHAVDLKWLFGEKAAKAQFKALVTDKPVGFADVRRLAPGEFPAEYADKACTFRSMDVVTSEDESQVSPFAEWKVDIVLTAEEEIEAGSISLAGLLPSTGKWMPVSLPAKLEAGQEVAVIATWVAPMFQGSVLPPSLHYCSKTIKAFTCGVKNNAPANAGKKLKVTLRLTDKDDKTKTLDVATVETVL